MEEQQEDAFINGELLGELLGCLKGERQLVEPAEHYVELAIRHYAQAMLPIEEPLHTDKGIELCNRDAEQSIAFQIETGEYSRWGAISVIGEYSGSCIIKFWNTVLLDLMCMTKIIINFIFFLVFLS